MLIITFQTHQEMIQTAKAVAENGQKMLKFAKILSKHCIEERYIIT